MTYFLIIQLASYSPVIIPTPYLSRVDCEMAGEAVKNYKIDYLCVPSQKL